jgi:hypothetical protein
MFLKELHNQSAYFRLHPVIAAVLGILHYVAGGVYSGLQTVILL